MTLITPERLEAETEDLLTSVVGSIRALRSELEDLRARVRAEEKLDKTADSNTVKSAVALLDTCQKVENRLAEYRQKNAGIAQGGHALDLDKARAELGRKLDRLRDTSPADPLSE